jgi:hypothetical protein
MMCIDDHEVAAPTAPLPRPSLLQQGKTPQFSNSSIVPENSECFCPSVPFLISLLVTDPS